MKIQGIKLPDKCPENCPSLNRAFLPESLCIRCPIFNCEKADPILPPQHYRKDWAKVWKEWFDEGMKGTPELYF